MQREAIRLAAILIAVLALRRLRLRRRAGDEGRQDLDVTGLGLGRAWLVPGFRRLRVALLARLIRLVVALNERLRVRRNVRLRLARAEGLVRHEGLLPVVPAILEVILVAGLELLVVAAAATAFRPLRLEVRILLAELLVRRRDQAEIMLGVLEVVFGRHRIAGGLRVTGELEIFLRHVMRRAADFHIRAVGFINPCQRVVTAPVIVVVIVIVVAPAHALVVMLMLTVSHGLLFNNS